MRRRILVRSIRESAKLGQTSGNIIRTHAYVTYTHTHTYMHFATLASEHVHRIPRRALTAEGDFNYLSTRAIRVKLHAARNCVGHASIERRSENSRLRSRGRSADTVRTDETTLGARRADLARRSGEIREIGFSEIGERTARRFRSCARAR